MKIRISFPKMARVRPQEEERPRLQNLKERAVRLLC